MVLAAVLITVAGAGLVWIANVEPLLRGNTTLAINDPAAHARHASIRGLGVSGLIETVPGLPGLTFRYLITVRNDGRVPVTILDAGFPPAEQGPISLHVVGAIPDLYGPGSPRGVGSGVEPFRPFSLAPGTEAGLQLDVRLSRDACYEAGTSASWYQVPITFRLLGITRHADVDTGVEVRIAGTAATAC